MNRYNITSLFLTLARSTSLTMTWTVIAYCENVIRESSRSVHNICEDTPFEREDEGRLLCQQFSNGNLIGWPWDRGQLSVLRWPSHLPLWRYPHRSLQVSSSLRSRAGYCFLQQCIKRHYICQQRLSSPVQYIQNHLPFVDLATSSINYRCWWQFPVEYSFSSFLFESDGFYSCANWKVTTGNN